eukprot:jgi/Botrbrau1/5559/Bobra.0023s0042.1
MSWFLYRLGFAIRETGQALDRLGCRLQGNDAFLEPFYRHRPLQNLSTVKPKLSDGVFVAESASVSGNVELGPNASVWFASVLRGDDAAIRVGANSNIQDGTIIGTGKTYIGLPKAPTVIGNNVTVGHNAILDGVTLEDECLIGIGAILSSGVTVQSGAMVAAGAVVSPGTVIPSGQLWGGNPAKYLRELKPEEKSFLPKSAQHYVQLAASYK